MTTIYFLADWALRSSILILGGAFLLLVFRVRDVSVRLVAWIAMLCGSLLMPAMIVTLPGVPVRAIQTIAPSRVPAVVDVPPINAEQTIIPARPQPFNWARAAIALYALIAVALLLRILIGLVMSLRLLHSSRATNIADVRESDRVASPVTLGIVKPAIVLPSDWSQWDSRKLDAVLAHERSHIRRYDPLVQLVSAIHRALLWHSPLSWFLHSRIVRLAECASDDAAVAVSFDRESYAAILLEFIQLGGPLRGVPMARYGRADKRIQRILDGVNLSRGVTRWSVAAILVLGSPLAYVIAMASPDNPLPLPQAPTLSAPVAAPDVVPAAIPALPDVPKPRVAAAAPENKDLTALDTTIRNLEFQLQTLRKSFSEKYPPIKYRQIELDALKARRAELAENDVPKPPAPQSPERAPEQPTALALGTVTAVTVGVRARIDGQLLSVSFKEGEIVQAGQVLATIDPNSVRELHAAERQRDLDPRGSDIGAVRQRAADDAQINYLKELTQIQAPITGMTGLRLAEPGQMVHAADERGIVVITQVQPIAVIFDIPQDFLPGVRGRLRAGSRPVVESWNRDNTLKIATGVLTAMDNQIDESKGTVKLKAIFDNKDGALFPNQFVNVRLY